MSWRIVFIVLVQSLVLMTMIGMKQWTLNTGTPILLETQPIDPRSLFRGDYVRLNYKISRLTLKDIDGDDEFERYDRFYLVLQPGERYWEPVSIHHAMPKLNTGQVAIKGTVKYVNNRIWNNKARTEEDRKYSILTARYGIENYFVPEGTGMELERPRDGKRVELRVAVDKSGNAGIKGVLLDGEERYTESLF